MRAVGLLSGGLDSTLALRLMVDQGIDLVALNFVSVFCTCTPSRSSCSVATLAARRLGIELKVVNTSRDFLQIVRNPKHGYGRHLNPCLDCRILMMRRAHEYMREVGASFLVTGEVLGERPMSQRLQAMRLIEKEAGVKGLVVRPLSAALLEPSLPELEGWVDRQKFLGIQGRSRGPQIDLARSRGIADYPCPAGGCRLTDREFAERMRDLMAFSLGCSLNDVQLLTVGRHFRLSPRAKAVVGRNEAENEVLRALSVEGDVVLEVAGTPGPLTVLRGHAGQEEVLLSAALTARYSKARHRNQVRVSAVNGNRQQALDVDVVPADDEWLASVRVGNARPSHKRERC